MNIETIFSGILDVNESTLDDDSGPETLACWTSRVHFELVTAIEEVFGIMLTRDEIRAMQTLGAARRLVEEKLGRSD